MVSFQCNGCGDVLTKPKLDKHRAMCNSSFDCIDCSKRFETPADYKGHTSCISEAEKYQKTSYNGGKQNGPGRNNRNQVSRQWGGGRQREDNRPQWQKQTVNRATGANGTPLGTPVRMSPVNDTPAVEENTQKSLPAAKTSEKRKAEPETIESKDVFEPAKKKKKQKTAKRGLETVDASVAEVKSEANRKSTSVTITERPPQDLDFQLAEDGNEKEAKKKKEKRKKKEDTLSSGQQPNSVLMADVKVTVPVQPPVTEVSWTINEETRSIKKKSRSKESNSKSKVAVTNGAADVPVPIKSPQPATLEVTGMARDGTADRKKRRQGGNHQRDGGDGNLVAQGGVGFLKEKPLEKKKKRKSQGQTVSVVE